MIAPSPRRLTTCLRSLLLVIVSASFLPSALQAAGPDGDWSQIAPYTSPNNAVAGATSFTMVLDTNRNRLIVFSGDPGPKNDVWTIALTPGSQWTLLIPNGTPPTARYGSAAVYDPVNDRMIVFGGYTGAGILNDIWSLSFSGTPAWTQLTPSGIGPTPRQDVAAIYDPVGQRMVMFGGYLSTGFWTQQTWALSLSGPLSWTQLSPSGPLPAARNVVGSIYDSSRRRMVLFGGWSGSYLGDTWALDLAGGGTWSQIVTATSPPPRRQSYAAYDAPHDAMILFGGFDGSNRSDIWRLPLASGSDWAPLSAAGTPPTARYGGRAAYDPVNARFLVCGGVDVAYRLDVEALDLAGSGGWSTFYDDLAAVSPHPGRRRDYSFVIDPSTSAAYLFGGTERYFYNFSGVVLVDTDRLHVLGLANPQPQWQPVEIATPRPTARHGHRAVWDPVRHRMLMFGGYDVTYLNDLWAMTPGATPMWEHLSPGGALPGGRMLFGMGYDPVRDRVVIVGGHSGFPPSGPVAYRNDVWALPLSGPGAMTWVPLSPAGTPPEARWIYDMSYDPPRDRMVLFGGVTASGRPNDAWALNLSGGTSWTQLSPAGTPPTGRSDHAMIYEPALDRMVVFGGYDGAFQNDVWSLALGSSGSWTQLNPTGGPPADRDIMHAVYDPLLGRMVIFGGWDGLNMLRDTWTLTWAPQVVPVQASLVSSDAEPGRVRLTWFVSEAQSVDASVERQGAGEAWRRLGSATRFGSDRMQFEDLDVTPGATYEYRLRLLQGGAETLTAAASVVVPTGHTLALYGANPNPGRSDHVRVAFSLPRMMRARIEMLDMAGRRVLARDVGESGAGRHIVDLTQGSRLAAGIYVVRLVTDERSLSAKALVAP